MIRHRMIVASLLLYPAVSADAQRVDLLLREEGSLAPIGGAIVRLLADTGAVAVALTAESGRIVLVAPGPGTYRIKADRIGWVGLLSGEFTLAAGQTLPSELLMPSARFELPPVEVRTRSRCEGLTPGAGEAPRVWEEIQKALTANLLTDAARIPLRVREFHRLLRRDGGVLDEFHVLSQVTEGPVYASLPPERLAAEGFFLASERDSLIFAVPDARLLISDAFASTHCYGVTAAGDSLVGLTFAPAPGRRLPDVTGTIWIERATGELRFLEYRYTAMPGLLARADLGGRVEYQRLPDGRWIVSYWHVRTPEIRMTEVRATGNVRTEMPRHLGYIEVGGRVAVAGADAETDLAILVGQVSDPTAGGIPLTGARIRVEGVSAVAVTDAEGRYALAVPAAGPRTVTATHPKLGHLSPATERAVLSIGDTARADFAVPPIGDFARRFCGGGYGRRSGVIGLVLLEDGTGGRGVEVGARWHDPSRGERETRVRSDGRGLFAFCDLPAETAVTLVIERQGVRLSERPLETGFREFLWADLWLIAGTDGASAGLSDRRGAAGFAAP